MQRHNFTFSAPILLLRVFGGNLGLVLVVFGGNHGLVNFDNGGNFGLGNVRQEAQKMALKRA